MTVERAKDPATASAAVARSSAPPGLLREPPATGRGMRTRAALVKAARAVFERQGYLDARLTDIAKEAKVATGTFYTYFSNKEEAFAAVLEQVQEEMLHPGTGRVAETDDPYAVLEASNRAYLEAYRRNAKLMGLLEQVAHVDSAFRDFRTERADAFFRRNARAIAELQERGIADADLDPLLAARALSGMVSRMAFNTFVVHEDDPVDVDELVMTLSRLWANALRFPGHR